MNETTSAFVSAKQTAERMLYDSELRAKLRDKDPDALAEIGLRPEGSGSGPGSSPIEYKVVDSTRDTLYIAMPVMSADEGEPIPMEDLSKVQAGNTASTVGTSTSASTISTLCGTISSASTAGTAGSVGSKGGMIDD